ncbi:MAG: hypothetical protein Q9213_002824 [Squamulea squamosa]
MVEHPLPPQPAVYQDLDATSRLLNLPVEIRLQIYSYLLPEASDYSISPSDTVGSSLRKESTPACPAILLTCRKVYLEAVPILYHKRCFEFTISGQLLRLEENHQSHKRNVINPDWWPGRRAFLKPQWHHYSVDRWDLDYTRVEEICLNFWLMHGCPIKLNEGRKVTIRLCRNLRKASRLRAISIIFFDNGERRPTTGATSASPHTADVEILLQPFKVLRRIQEVHIEMPSGRASDSDLRCGEEVKSVMVGSLPSLALY